MNFRVVLFRHGETAWSLTGQHTGRTDLPLTERGEQDARALGEVLRGVSFDHVLTSPLQRARRTCELAGFGAAAVVDSDLCEWDYGEYNGRTLDEIRADRPGWLVFRDGCPGGESPGDMSARADRVVGRLRTMTGVTAVFSHGHFLRSLAARWMGAPLITGQHLALETSSISALGYEHRDVSLPVIAAWNAVSNSVFGVVSARR